MPRKASPDELQEARRFGVLVKAHRQAAGLSRVALGRLCGLSENGIVSIEAGRSVPQFASACRLLRQPLLALTPDDLPSVHRVQLATLERLDRALQSRA